MMAPKPMNDEAYKALLIVNKQLDNLYVNYYSQGKLPGIFEAKTIFTELMKSWEAYRKARGL